MTVHLVGAGPGDPDLLTVRALRLLGLADVVVHDALVDEAVLRLVQPRAHIIDVGKRPGCGVPQIEINDLLVDFGRRYNCVVRLKGGDPYIFGRGGEEAIALTAAGVRCEVVPGVSSALAAPAAAGIPVTHRDVAVAVTVVTGHRRDGASPLDWSALARVGSTIVVLMGVAQRAAIAEGLIRGGLAASTPVAVIETATRRGQRVRRTTIAELASMDMKAPATIVIGAVAAYDLASFPVAGHAETLQPEIGQAEASARS
jgi:uroporphyrin-III C-methyltransferase